MTNQIRKVALIAPGIISASRNQGTIAQGVKTGVGIVLWEGFQGFVSIMAIIAKVLPDPLIDLILPQVNETAARNS